MFESGKKNPSVAVAKDRLRLLVSSDRLSCTPDIWENLNRELYQTVSKYMEITKEDFDIQITRTYIYIKLTGEKP